MRVDVLTLFPRMFEGVFGESLLAKARTKGLADLRVHDIRAFADNKHRTVDDRPYGGGPGMVIQAEPVHRALKSVGAAGKGRNKPFVIYLSPQGRPFTQALADRLAKKKRLVLLCGHYEGVDERIFEWIDLEVSLGDVVLTGGEIPAMAVVDAVVRKIPGTVKEADSLAWDSFADGWRGRLDCPHYTRPAEWRGRKVPPVLLGGDHKAIAAWREAASAAATKKKRPDLLKIKK
ncbi:MAG TPA: tRNA (guanosine(37)-N1)-methyltransferase TrmD [Elusimicrobiota bacterium]|nr:tRNA (guanosine(37)-N1)-methyltransferase TrmD [Elusimicrobiota bacterium]HNA60507.1 tRNA (guanosine(37)-N1)-methyltransferase TrmD [Elusimicrobiota bacterium]HNC74428.1 tRNA (guanosine(37)-N1)-methyltransferase TrmD [Elusimicrobiota bacterium]HND64339.1 tRNA (guanosine(37)-N1)-methyltransferase TrmD [Elusimicrobiota bacterium]HNG44805.1 tRNA (guanosine(37)-N1)-methyltransferase TrmD [Elusimicrobiota bacterium]